MKINAKLLWDTIANMRHMLPHTCCKSSFSTSPSLSYLYFVFVENFSFSCLLFEFIHCLVHCQFVWRLLFCLFVSTSAYLSVCFFWFCLVCLCYYFDLFFYTIKIHFQSVKFMTNLLESDNLLICINWSWIDILIIVIKITDRVPQPDTIVFADNFKR